MMQKNQVKGFGQRMSLVAGMLIGLAGLPGVVVAEMPTAGGDASMAAPVARLNINQASAEEIAQTLKGIGLKKAEAIVQWREEHGEFSSVDQLMQVKGVGSATLAKNRAFIAL